MSSRIGQDVSKRNIVEEVGKIKKERANEEEGRRISENFKVNKRFCMEVNSIGKRKE